LKTVLSIQSGAGGYTHGAVAAGYTPIGAIELNPKVAEIYRQNLGQITVANILDCKPHKFELPDLLLLSPSCRSFSIANPKGSENAIDISIANHITKFIRKLQPGAIVLENVESYANSESWRIILASLWHNGYTVQAGKHNAADLGAATSRVRFLARAVKNGTIHPIAKTHGLFLKPYIGWYQAIEDLIPDLPASMLTPAQQKSVQNSQIPVIVERIGYRDAPKTWPADFPIGTIRAHLADDGHGGSRSKYLDIWFPQEQISKSINTTALARLQGFPDNLFWSGRSADDVRAIGDSVVPLVATRAIESIAY
jgi:site-specific DNA-cytosine methylase